MNILKNPDFVAKLGYSDFPLRHHLYFSNALGQLLPVFQQLLNPGDKVVIKDQLITRTDTLESSAFSTIHEHIDWFFVPLRNLYKFFGDVFFGIDDVHTSLLPTKSSITQTYPFVNLKMIRGNLLTQGADKLDQSGTQYAANCIRLCDHLGIPVKNAFTEEFFNDKSNLAISLWFPLAYQNIYYNYYRLSDREENNTNAYNADYFALDVNYFNNIGVVNDIFTLRYRPMYRDFFHSCQVSPLFGPSSLNSLGNNDSFYNAYSANVGFGLNNGSILNYVNQWLIGRDDTGYSYVSRDPSSDLDTIDNKNLPTDISGYSSPNRPTAIRALFAAEKLWEITRRAGKHYDDQLLAHFGVDITNERAGEPIFIGSHDSDLVIGDVIATAQSDGVDLGQVGGKGYNNSSMRPLNYTAKEHGVLMAIYSSDVDLSYADLGLDRQNTYFNSMAFWRPEFDELGMQPLYRYQSNLKASHPNDEDNQDIDRDNSEILGWTPRYFELKCKYNRSIGAVGFNSSLSSWVSSIDAPVSTDLKNYLVLPWMLDNIMVKKYDSKIALKQQMDNFSTIYDTDPLIHDLYFDVLLVSKMSPYGLPRL